MDKILRLSQADKILLFKQQKQVEKNQNEGQFNLKIFRNSALFKNTKFKTLYDQLSKWNTNGRQKFMNGINRHIFQSYNMVYQEMLRLQKNYSHKQRCDINNQLQQILKFLPYKSRSIRCVSLDDQLRMPKCIPSQRTKSMQKYYLQCIRMHKYHQNVDKQKKTLEHQANQYERQKVKYHTQLKQLRNLVQQKQIDGYLSNIAKNKARLVSQRMKMRRFQPINCLNLKYGSSKYNLDKLGSSRVLQMQNIQNQNICNFNFEKQGLIESKKISQRQNQDIERNIYKLNKIVQKRGGNGCNNPHKSQKRVENIENIGLIKISQGDKQMRKNKSLQKCQAVEQIKIQNNKCEKDISNQIDQPEIDRQLIMMTSSIKISKIGRSKSINFHNESKDNPSYTEETNKNIKTNTNSGKNIKIERTQNKKRNLILRSSNKRIEIKRTNSIEESQKLVRVSKQ